jgi:phosphoribosylformylglycinamidine synthase subunit PurSL
MGIHEIRVYNHSDDPKAEALRHQAKALYGEEVEVTTSQVYYVEGVNQSEAETLGNELFTQPVTQISQESPRPDWDDDTIVEVALQPGTMNPAAQSIQYGAELLGIKPVAVDSGTEVWFGNGTPKDVIDRVTKGLLVNDTIQRVRTKSPESLRLTGERGPIEVIPIRDLSDEGLMELSEKRKLALNLDEMKVLQNQSRKIGRDLRDGEVEMPAGRWSEHCGHKTFNAKIFKDGLEKAPLFERIKDASRQYFGEEVLSAFHDNSGVFKFYDGQAACIKLETHNSPMNLEPFGGSATGTGGVLRDIAGTGKGAKNILSIDIFCFAPLDYTQGQVPGNCFTPAYMQRRALEGVRDYGNPMGIPTANGSMHYHPDFRGKSSVLVGAVGMMPEQYAERGYPEPGDLVVTVGGRTGRDGIHGATFSSESMTADTAAVHSGAVQIGNPIEEKKMFDALLEARDAGLIRAITDCGAAGFSSAIGEMAEEIGAQVDISLAPLKYEGLAPWEIWMSESQERMILAISPQNYELFAEICAKHGTEIAALGTFGTPDGPPKMLVTYDSEVLIDLDYEFLNSGLPQREIVAEWNTPAIPEIVPEISDWEDAIKKVLSHGNVCSKEPIVRQFDHEVQGMNVMKPYGGVHKDAPNNAVVLQPMPDRPYGLVVAHGLNPVLNSIDPYHGSTWAVAEAFSNLVAAGGNPDKAQMVNNYITATPTEHVMGQLDMMVDAVTDSIHALKRPVISGKDSLSSTYKGEEEVIEIPPVLAMTVASPIEDINKTVTTDIKKPGSTLVLVGEMDEDAMGGSTLYDVLNGISGNIPKVNLETLPQTLRGMYNAIQSGEVLACHDVSEGGVIAAVSEMCFGGDCGVRLHMDGSGRPENMIFNETAGCFMVEVENEQTARQLFKGLNYRTIGTTTAEKSISAVRLGSDGANKLFEMDTDDLRAAWKRPIEETMA